MLLCNSCRLRGCTLVSAAQLMGGSLLCWRNFLLNLSPKPCCNLRQEVVVTTFSHPFLFACPPCTSPTRSLSVLQATLSDEENQLTTPQLSTITEYQPSTWDLAALKATFLGITDSFSGFFSHGSIPYPEALHQTCHPMKQGFSGTPHSSVPGCWLFSWHAAWLGDGSPALLTPLSLLSPATRCFWRGKQSKNWTPLVSWVCVAAQTLCWSPPSAQ